MGLVNIWRNRRDKKIEEEQQRWIAEDILDANLKELSRETFNIAFMNKPVSKKPPRPEPAELGRAPWGR